MKVNELEKKSQISSLKELCSLPEIFPKYGENIVYRGGYYDGILSGHLRWNGGMFGFYCILDDIDTPEWTDKFYISLLTSKTKSDFKKTIEDYKDSGCFRYYAVYLIGQNKLKRQIKKHISFCVNVNPGSEYRKKKYKNRIACPTDDWKKWYDRKWPEAQEESYDNEVVAWFKL